MAVLHRFYCTQREFCGPESFEISPVHGIIFSSSDKYDQIENELIAEFRIAHHEGDKKKMRRCASVLSNFKVRSEYMFPNHAQNVTQMSPDGV